MDRREVIKSMSLALGYSLTPGALTVLMSSCTQKGRVEWKPTFLAPDEAFAIEQLAEVILPKTEIPGAKDIRAVAFLDVYLSDVMKIEDRDKFKTGMDYWIKNFESRIQKSIAFALTEDFSTDFKQYFDIDKKEQANVKALLKTSETKEKSEKYYIYNFLFTVKNLTMLGFYASEEIGENVLSYLPIPENYQGCVPAEQIGNAWSL